jgi:glycosyltransferase involved in cell wall biosynthesis
MVAAEQIHLEIVLPCYNPREGWAKSIVASMASIQSQLPDLKLGLIVVNDGSSHGVTPESIEFLKQVVPGTQFISYPDNKGKGHALRKGMETATAPLVIYTDVDFPYEEKSFVNLCRKLQSGEADVIAGVRDDTYYAKVPPGRKRISKILRWMLRTFLRLQITDTQCGLKGFNNKGRNIFLQTRINRFLFDLEFIYLASNDDELKLMPCEVALKPGIVFSKMSFRILLLESFNFFKIFIRGFFGRLFRRKKKA